MGKKLVGELRSNFPSREKNPWQPIVPEQANEPKKHQELVGKRFLNVDSGVYEVTSVFAQKLEGSEQWSARLESVTHAGQPHINKPIDEVSGTLVDPNHTWNEIPGK